METKVTLSELEQAKVLFPEEIKELKEDFEIMSLHLTLDQMKMIRPLFVRIAGLINFIMGMNENELNYCRGKISEFELKLRSGIYDIEDSLLYIRDEVKKASLEKAKK